MKPEHAATSTVITTPQQRELIERLTEKHLEIGGCILAQVFPDGLRLRVLTPVATSELQHALTKALGTRPSNAVRNSAFDVPGEGGAV